eukprot:scaffold17366_cov182-Amphora_coffeaeformis.AAC.9
MNPTVSLLVCYTSRILFQSIDPGYDNKGGISKPCERCLGISWPSDIETLIVLFDPGRSFPSLFSQSEVCTINDWTARLQPYVTAKSSIFPRDMECGGFYHKSRQRCD